MKKNTKPKKKRIPKGHKRKDGTWAILGTKKVVRCMACLDTGENSKGRSCICQERNL